MIDIVAVRNKYAADDEELMIVGQSMWTQSTSVTDRQTDRITITKTVQRIASHGNNGMLKIFRPK